MTSCSHMTASWLQSGMAISRTGLKCSYHISLPRTEVESLNHRKLVRRGEIIKMVRLTEVKRGLMLSKRIGTSRLPAKISRHCARNLFYIFLEHQLRSSPQARDHIPNNDSKNTITPNPGSELQYTGSPTVIISTATIPPIQSFLRTSFETSDIEMVFHRARNQEGGRRCYCRVENRGEER
jgi:hypothetical protein